jgi:uncharacterized protein YjbJ (UPF0337 family)
MRTVLAPDRQIFARGGSIIRTEHLNWDIGEGNWKQFQGYVKEQWGKLTDDSLDTIAGKRDQLAGKIQEAYGISKDEAEAADQGI